MNILLNKISTLIILMGLSLIIISQPSPAQNTNTILILPFGVQADPKYDFLRPALTDMLFTRLSAPGRTIIVDESNAATGIPQAETITLTDAIQLGQQKGADYLVTGSIVLQDDATSTNAEFIGIDEQRALIVFNQKGTRPGDIITQIDNFTAQVNADIFSPGASTDEQTSQSGMPDDIHQHPEKMVIPETTPDESPKNEPTEIRELPSTSQPVDNR